MAERIEYIDSAKGLCMLLIVASHVGIADPWPGAYTVRVILFFVLSGFFFSTKLAPKEFIQKKVKTLLVPFIFWWVVSYALFYACMAFIPGFSSMTPARGIFDCFTQKEYFNGPLWFLLALFFLQVICYVVERLFGTMLWRVITYGAIGLLGYELAMLDIDLPLDIDVALSATPFFAMGMILKRYDVLSMIDTQPKMVVTSIFFYGVYLLCPVAIFMSVNHFNGSLMDVFGIGMSLCMSYILLIKLMSIHLSRLTGFLSYIGRNSLYIMCAHHLMYRPIKMLLQRYPTEPFDGIILLVASTGLCLLTAPLVERYAPMIIGKYRKK